MTEKERERVARSNFGDRRQSFIERIWRAMSQCAVSSLSLLLNGTWNEEGDALDNRANQRLIQNHGLGLLCELAINGCYVTLLQIDNKTSQQYSKKLIQMIL